MELTIPYEVVDYSTYFIDVIARQENIISILNTLTSLIYVLVFGLVFSLVLYYIYRLLKNFI